MAFCFALGLRVGVVGTFVTHLIRMKQARCIDAFVAKYITRVSLQGAFGTFIVY